MRKPHRQPHATLPFISRLCSCRDACQNSELLRRVHGAEGWIEQKSSSLVGAGREEAVAGGVWGQRAVQGGTGRRSNGGDTTNPKLQLVFLAVHGLL